MSFVPGITPSHACKAARTIDQKSVRVQLEKHAGTERERGREGRERERESMRACVRVCIGVCVRACVRVCEGTFKFLCQCESISGCMGG